MSFYCPQWRFRMPADFNGHRPGTAGSSSDAHSWSYFRIGSLRMNEWLSAAATWDASFPDTNTRLSAVKPSVFILTEGYNDSRFTNMGMVYFHPGHAGRAPFLFADGRVEPRSYFDAPYRGSSANGQQFWGQGAY
jgi:prepilin-type processing-associated H-X9-DG protein